MGTVYYDNDGFRRYMDGGIDVILHGWCMVTNAIFRSNRWMIGKMFPYYIDDDQCMHLIHMIGSECGNATMSSHQVRIVEGIPDDSMIPCRYV